GPPCIVVGLAAGVDLIEPQLQLRQDRQRRPETRIAASEEAARRAPAQAGRLGQREQRVELALDLPSDQCVLTHANIHLVVDSVEVDPDAARALPPHVAYLTSRTVTEITPHGAGYRICSPTRRPRSPRPIGLSAETRSAVASASSGSTKENCSSPRSSYTRAHEPTRITVLSVNLIWMPPCSSSRFAARICR